MGKCRDLGAFLTAAFRNPATVGAIAPSSAGLANQLAAVVPTGNPIIVELGAGTGAVTAVIQRRLAGRGRHIAIELDPVLADYLRRGNASVNASVEVVVGDAAALRQILAERDIQTVDAVISGLPWSLFPLDIQSEIIRVIVKVLRSEGTFTTFAYIHALPLRGARRFRALLHELFDEVVTTRAVWKNLPPAVTYVCRRPRSLHADSYFPHTLRRH